MRGSRSIVPLVVAYCCIPFSFYGQSNSAPETNPAAQSTDQLDSRSTPSVTLDPANPVREQGPAPTITENLESLKITTVPRPPGFAARPEELVQQAISSTNGEESGAEESELLKLGPAATTQLDNGGSRLELVFQSFYNRINDSTAANLRGGSVSYVRFFPKWGVLDVHLEPIGDRDGFLVGENALQWRGLPWKGRHWDFALGDFRSSTAIYRAPFNNIIQPDLFVRGARVEARSRTWRVSLYGGRGTLSAGHRIPFRTLVPQTALGGEVSGQPYERVSIGVRYLNLRSSSRWFDQRTFVPITRRFTDSNSLTSQIDLKLFDALHWYTEAGVGGVREVERTSAASSAISLLTGPALQTSWATVKADYVHQGVTYLPVVGYYLGDRRGPHAEAFLSLWRFDVSGSWGQLRNNIEKNLAAPTFFSRQSSAGVSIRLPLRFALSSGLSQFTLESRDSGAAVKRSRNLQMNISLSRAIFNHSLRTTLQQVDTDSQQQVQRLRFAELEDTFQFRRFTVGAAVRWQNFNSDQRRDSIFVRGTAQAQISKLTVYAYIEQGKDLANSTLFATNLFSTSVAGLSWTAPHKVSIQLEAFRNSINTSLNPESIFVLSAQGVPVDTSLSRYGNWSVYARLTKTIESGDRLIFDNTGQIQKEAPLTGTIAGFVHLRTMAGQQPAAAVWVVLDNGKRVVSDANGYFEFLRVPDGIHQLAIDMDRLPADFDIYSLSQFQVIVNPQQLSRVEFNVIPLLSFTGSVEDVEGGPAENIVVRLGTLNRVTTTDSRGLFGFYGVPEGDYVIEVDAETLPERAQLISANAVSVMTRYKALTPPIRFTFEVFPVAPKAIRKVLEGQLSVF